MYKTRDFLAKLGLPRGDAYNLPTSKKRFSDNAQYRFEVPGIQGPGTMKTLLEEIDKYQLVIHRVTQTKGIMTLTDDEIIQMVDLADLWKVDLILAIGPRATTDTSASVHTKEGQRIGYRLRGQEQIVRAVEDVKRASRLGCRSFLVYDEGDNINDDKDKDENNMDDNDKDYDSDKNDDSGIDNLDDGLC
jgi:hypothetical protein